MFMPTKTGHEEELLERPNLLEAHVRGNLAHLRHINCYLGGIRVVRNFPGFRCFTVSRHFPYRLSLHVQKARSRR